MNMMKCLSIPQGEREGLFGNRSWVEGRLLIFIGGQTRLGFDSM
jgi:hypothetical protein